MPELVMPADGAAVANPITVAIGFIGPNGRIEVPPGRPIHVAVR